MKNKVLAFFLLVSSVSVAQLQSSLWYFGDSCAVQFGANGPQNISPSSMHATEACASIADKNGNLLFYTNGEKVWNRNNAIMTNGLGLNGSRSATQGALIIPFLGDPERYYIFTTNGIEDIPPDELNYSVVNMAMGNEGKVETKNIRLHGHSGEKLTAVTHADLTGTWIIASSGRGDTLYSYLIDCNGVNSTPQISAFNFNFLNVDIGCLEASKDGKTLIAAYTGDNTLVAFDFDTKTGKVSNPNIITSNFHRVYSVEFSPDDKLIYAAGAFVNNPSTGITNLRINQYERFSPNNISTTEKIIYENTNEYRALGMQRALDGKIYFFEYNARALSSIDNPNQLNPTVTENVITFNHGLFRALEGGLPNFFNIYLHGDDLSNYSFTDTICFGDSITIGPENNLTASYSWAPNNSLSNLSIANPVATPTVSTTYQLSIINECNDTILYTHQVNVHPPSIIGYTANYLSGCSPLSVSFLDTTKPKSKYIKWDFGDGYTDSIFNPSHLFQHAGKYSIKLLSTDSNNCKSDSLIKLNYIEVYKIPEAKFTFNPTVAGIFEPIQFLDSSTSDNGSIISWQWNFGDETGNATMQNPHYTFKNSGAYLVNLTVTDEKNCTDSVEHLINITADPLVYTPNSFTPNGDGINDVFRLNAFNPISFDIRIFDRWGNELFYSDDIDNSWKGLINNKPAQPDNYIYVLNVSFPQSINKTIIGTVSLIR